MVEEYTEGIIQYPPDRLNQSYRDLVHECVDGYPWVKFGIDLLIGSPADSTINVRDKMFIPDYLMDLFSRGNHSKRRYIERAIGEKHRNALS